jgi:hypothetical protein
MDPDFDNALKKWHRHGRTYWSSEMFFADLRAGNLMDNFLLDEGAFQEIAGEIAASRKVAEEVNNNSVLIVLKVDKSMELGGLLELAESFANG